MDELCGQVAVEVFVVVAVMSVVTPSVFRPDESMLHGLRSRSVDSDIEL